MEYKALHEHLDKIVNTIFSSSLEPHLLADRLYSARLIDDNAVEEASEAGIEKIVRIKRLMCEVRTQVERDPSNYYSFVKLAKDLPEVKNLLEQLQGVFTVYSPCIVWVCVYVVCVSVCVCVCLSVTVYVTDYLLG